MKVCLIGHFADNHDEGVRIVGQEIARGLQRNGIDVKKIDINNHTNTKEIYNFKPKIIHFILSPTILGLIKIKILSILSPSAKIIVSAVHPHIPNSRFIFLLKPDLILTQSLKSELFFKSIHFKTKFLPNGVDIEKFKAINSKEKIKLRQKYKLPDKKFIVLHLASMTKSRNLDVFKKIQQLNDVQVLILGREHEKNNEIIKELRESNCIVISQHIENVEEIYQLSDCYVFPTLNNLACIETPLSVLEAMACNLPIIATKFGALPRLFDQGRGLYYIDTEAEIPFFIDLLKKESELIQTRQLVLPYSWSSICKKLCKYYEELL